MVMKLIVLHHQVNCFMFLFTLVKYNKLSGVNWYPLHEHTQSKQLHRSHRQTNAKFSIFKFTFLTSGTSSLVLVHNRVLECTILLQLQA